MKYLCFVCLGFVFFSCSVMPLKEDRIARKNDFFNSLSRTELVAIQAGKFGDEYFKLRKNKTFVFRSEFMGIKNTYYYGTYTYADKILKLKFESVGGFDEANSTFILSVNNGKPCFINKSGWTGYIH